MAKVTKNTKDIKVEIIKKETIGINLELTNEEALVLVAILGRVGGIKCHARNIAHDLYWKMVRTGFPFRQLINSDESVKFNGNSDKLLKEALENQSKLQTWQE